MSSHQIRLAGPWQWQRVAEVSEAEIQPELTCKLPFHFGEELGTTVGVQLHRGFHRPTGIGSQTTLAILLDVRESVTSVQLNNEPLSLTDEQSSPTFGNVDVFASMRLRFEISRLLKPFNDLTVTLSRPTPGSRPELIAAMLEIREMDRSDYALPAAQSVAKKESQRA